MSPDLARRILAAYEAIRRSLTEAELVRAIQSGGLDRLLLEVLDDATLDRGLRPLGTYVDRVVAEASRLEAADLPARARLGVFNVLSPHVVEAARILDTRVLTSLKEEIRVAVMQHVTAGLEAGRGPRAIARGVREVVGLAPNQEAAVRNFRRLLEVGDPAALKRKLRDRRFDATLRRILGGEPASRDKIDRMVDAYRRKMVAFNAETQARTATLDALKLGQRAAWLDAIERGVVERSMLRRVWLAVGGPGGDGRNRPEHLALHGTEVGFDEPFPNGELVPGESTYNCRCRDRVILATAAMRLAA